MGLRMPVAAGVARATIWPVTAALAVAGVAVVAVVKVFPQQLRGIPIKVEVVAVAQELPLLPIAAVGVLG
jgi:hypothetical protein